MAHNNGNNNIYHAHVEGFDIVTTYGACRRTHIITGMGGQVYGLGVDNCEVFVPGSEEGLYCATCQCHRSFHRRIDMRLPPTAAAAPAQFQIYAQGYAAGGRQRRLRTVFTPQQRERLRTFAHRIRWRLQGQSHRRVNQFCYELGICREVLMNWLRNNRRRFQNENEHDGAAAEDDDGSVVDDGTESARD